MGVVLLACICAAATASTEDIITRAAPKKKQPANPDIKIGVANMEEVYWELQPSIEKACKFIAAAGDQGIKLLTFSEGVISGYPWWNWWTHTFDMAANEMIQGNWAQNSPRVGYPELDPLLNCIKKAQVNVVMPTNERDNKGSQAAVFNAALFIDSNGTIVGRHRKVLPSFTERFWWTHGDGSDLIVVDMPGVGKVCALLCWENYVLMARYTLIAQGCEFWIAPTQDIGSPWVNHIKSIAKEAGAYVMSTGQMLRPAEAAKSPLATQHSGNSKWVKDMTDDFNAVGGGASTNGYFMDAGSVIVNPYGQTLNGPIYSGCTHCYPQCPVGVRESSIEWARDSGCPNLDGLGPTERCNFLKVTGITRPTTNPNDEEFIIWSVANRDQTIAAKKANVNVGPDLAPKGIFKVTWNNRPTSYITEVKGKVSGSHPIFVDTKWRPAALPKSHKYNGLDSKGM